MKNSFIQSLLFQNSSATIPNDLFCNNDKVDENPPASNDDYLSDYIDGTKDEDINNEDNNLDKKNITIRENKNKIRKDKIKTLKIRTKK